MGKNELQFSRIELYNLVWAQPISIISKQFQIRESLVRKKCKENDIPTPKSGYWSKLKFNKQVSKTPLSENSKNNQIIDLADAKFKIRHSIKDKTKTSSPKTLPFRVLSNPHPFVKSAKREFIINVSKYGSCNGLYGTGLGYLSISVSPECLDRSLIQL